MMGRKILTIGSHLDTKNPRYQAAYERELTKAKALQKLFETAATERSEKAHKRLANQNRRLVHKNIQDLIDEGTKFYDFGQFAGGEHLPLGGVVAGIGEIHGRKCVIIANDSTVDYGQYSPITVKKHLRALEFAQKNNLPVVTLLDTGGIKQGVENEFQRGESQMSDVFNIVRLANKDKTPQITAVMGPCVGEASNLLFWSDYTIMTEETGAVYLDDVDTAQSALVAGKDLRKEKDIIPSDVDGDIHRVVKDQKAAIAHIRATVKNLKPANTTTVLKKRKPYKPSPFKAEDIYGIVGDQTLPDEKVKRPHEIDMMQVIARLVDGNKDGTGCIFEEYGGDMNDHASGKGSALVCGTATMRGIKVGIVATQSYLMPKSAIKGTEFIKECCEKKIPLIYLQDTVGYMIGLNAEENGIGKYGANMVMATANASVPKITIFIRNSIGAGNYGNNGEAYNNGGNLTIMASTAKISVMGPEMAAKVMKSVKEDQLKGLRKKLGDDKVWSDFFPFDNADKYYHAMVEKYKKEQTPRHAAIKLWNLVTVSDINEIADTAGYFLETMVEHRHVPNAEFGNMRPVTLDL